MLIIGVNIMFNTYFYLASPYSHKSDRIRISRGDRVTKYGAKLIKAGVLIYAPITTSREFVRSEPSLGNGFETWESLDLTFVQLSSGVIVYMLPGWEKSIGVRAEIDFAKEIRKDIYYMEPSCNEKEGIIWLKQRYEQAADLNRGKYESY